MEREVIEICAAMTARSLDQNALLTTRATCGT
jgi:hypothetical protein